jgi:Uma2 family endonuclease
MPAIWNRKEIPMPRPKTPWPAGLTVAGLLDHLGHVAPERIRLDPAPGRATEKDVLRIHDREDRLYELIDGVLVEKVMGMTEACLAAELGRLLGNFVAEHGLGFVAGADGTIRLLPGLVRIPDLSFTSWQRVGRREYPREPIPDLAPDLVVEVLSEGNTAAEMARKLKDYFVAGVRLVWFVDPLRRSVRVHTAPDQSQLLTEDQTLTGGEVLPGFEVPLGQLFAAVPHDLGSAPRATRPRKKKS